MTGTGCNKGNDAKMVRQQARMEKRDADYQEKQSRRAMRYTASPQALHAIQPTLAYCEKMREQYSLLKKMEGVNDRALEIQDEYKVLINKLDSALQEGKVEKAQHVAKQINKRVKEQKHLKQDFHRFRDDYAANVNYWGIATGVLLPTTIILGSYCIYQSMQSHGTNNQTTPGADKPYLPPPDHEFTVDHENGTIAMDGDVVAHVNILKTTNATFLLGEKNYQDHKKFLDDKYNATGLDGIQLTFHEDGSLHVEVKGENAVVFNDLDAKQVHQSGIFQKISGKDIYGHQINYTLLPGLKEKAYEVDFHIDGKFMEDQALKNVTTGMANTPTVMKITADGDGVITGQLGNYDNDGNFTALSQKNLTEEQAKDVAYTLADNNPDADKPVNQLFEKIAHNGESDAKNVYHTAVTKHAKFLKDYNFTSDKQVGEFIDKMKNYTAAVAALEADHNCSGKNLSGFDDYLHGVENVKNIHNALLDEWGFKLVEKFDQFVKDLNKNSTKLQNLVAKYNASDVDDLQNDIDGLLAANATANKLYKDLNVTDADGVMGYVNGLLGKISDTNAQLEIMSKPWKVSEFKNDYNKSTAVFQDHVEEARNLVNLTGYTLNWTDNATKEWFRDLNISGANDMADIFDNPENPVVRVDIQDAINEGDERSAVLVTYIEKNGKLQVSDYYELTEKEWQSVKDSKK